MLYIHHHQRSRKSRKQSVFRLGTRYPSDSRGRGFDCGFSLKISNSIACAHSPHTHPTTLGIIVDRCVIFWQWTHLIIKVITQTSCGIGFLVWKTWTLKTWSINLLVCLQSSYMEFLNGLFCACNEIQHEQSTHNTSLWFQLVVNLVICRLELCCSFTGWKSSE